MQEEICKRFQSKGIKPGSLRLQNLLTADGYELNPNGKIKIKKKHEWIKIKQTLKNLDIIETVISDGERLIALDYADWILTEKS